MTNNWNFLDIDREAIKELQSFLPDRIYDIHNHIYRQADLNMKGSNFWTQGPEEASIQVWRDAMSKYVGRERLPGALFFPVPSVNGSSPQGNEYLIEQLEQEPLSRGLILVAPGDKLEDVRHFLDHPQIAGFKIYHIYSDEKPTWQSSINGFCPSWMWEEADKRSMAVMLHMVKDAAVADPENIREIREACTKFPRMKLILAHAARCFHAPNAKGIHSLVGLQNVWFDSSAICEPEALKVIIKEFGPRRLLFGSDFPVTEIRARHVTVGNGFVWLDHDFCNWEKSPDYLGKPVLVGIEILRAIKIMIEDMGLNKEDVDDIFYNNAARLLSLHEESGTITQDLYRHAKERIPGGVQLLSKKPEIMAPDKWPAYFREARGCEVWDLDGKHYYDMSTNSVGSCLLGYRDPDVTKAVIRRVQFGSISSLNAPEEVELADLLCEIHPWAEQVRFTRAGGESCMVAVRIARATTDRSMVAICGYHGWHDWYLSANLGENDALRGHLLSGLDPLGVPRELRGTAVTFRYNDRDALQAIMDQHGDKLAAVIMEPCRSAEPDPGFLEFVRDSAHRNGALLVFDEVSIGWRLHYGGAHLKFGVSPDIAIFAKTMGNGHPVGAVIGSREAMKGAYGSFISSTNWTESVGPAAALTTIRKLAQVDAPAFVERAGTRVINNWKRRAEAHKLPIQINGSFPCLAHFAFQHAEPEKLRLLYTLKMLDRGFLAGASTYMTMAHTDEIIDLYDAAVDEVFGEIADALRTGHLDEQLGGKKAAGMFQRLI